MPFVITVDKTLCVGLKVLHFGVDIFSVIIVVLLRFSIRARSLLDMAVKQTFCAPKKVSEFFGLYKVKHFQWCTLCTFVGIAFLKAQSGIF